MCDLDDAGSEHSRITIRPAKRLQRERRRARFLDKALRTPRTARRWFRIEDIEPDAHARSNLIDQWRASIWHRDLGSSEGKSQVLCLSVSQLAENRFDPDWARGEQQFNAIVGDLWMSAERWLDWFHQDRANRKAPTWLEALVQSKRKQSKRKRGGRRPKYDRDEAEQYLRQLFDKRGDFDEPGQVDDWSCQRHAEVALINHMCNPDGEEPSLSWARERVTKVVKSWRADREQMK
jgi:hypothetical protein